VSTTQLTAEMSLDVAWFPPGDVTVRTPARRWLPELRKYTDDYSVSMLGTESGGRGWVDGEWRHQVPLSRACTETVPGVTSAAGFQRVESHDGAQGLEWRTLASIGHSSRRLMSTGDSGPRCDLSVRATGAEKLACGPTRLDEHRRA
jgi:hypothetical protein